MSEAKHTPGPWTWDPNPYSTGAYIRASDNRPIAIANQRNAAIDAEEMRANAALLCAAPCLLAACIIALDNLTAGSYDLDEVLRQQRCARQTLENVIAKATGATP